MYQFITIGGGQFFVDIFNAIASIIRSGDYANVVRIAGALAFFMAVINAALKNSLYDASKWFITTFIVLQVLLYPKASIHVTDKTNPIIKGAKIDNVPFVLAYTASTASVVGYKLTTLFETVFSLPDELKYSENGMLFGLNLFKAMSQAKIRNQNLSSSIDSFSRNCIFFDIHLRRYSFDDLRNSQDLWQFLGENQSENRFFDYINQENSLSYPSCKEGYVKLSADFENEVRNPSNLAFFAKKPDMTAQLLAKVTTDVNKYFLDVSKTSQETLKQAMMINALDDAMHNYEAKSRIESYQNARASMQAKSTYQAIGSQAGIWIPVLKIVIEAVFLGAFPLVLLLALIPDFTGSVLRGYFGTFVWLAAWGPLYAILHRVSMGNAQEYTLGLGGFTLYNQVGIENAMSDIAAMAGYMSMLVPMLAYGIARGGASAMSSMTTAFMSSAQSAASVATQETTTGNLSFGNVGMNSRAISSGVSIANSSGQIGRYHDDGSFSVDNSNVESRFGGFNLHGSQRMESSLSNSISQEQSIAESKAAQAQEMQSRGFERAINNHHSIENSQGFEQNTTAQEKESFSRISSAVEEFANEHNISNSESARIFGSLGGQIGVRSDLGARGFGVGSGASFNGGFEGSLNTEDRKIFSEAQRFSQDKRLSHDFEVMKSALQSDRLNVSDNYGESISKSFSSALNFSEEAGMHFEKAERLNSQKQHIESNSLDFDQSYNNEFVQHLRGKYGSEEAVFSITNPNNSDSFLRDKEVAEFNAAKSEELFESSSKIDLESRYEDKLNQSKEN